MPWINVVTSRPLSAASTEAIKTEFAATMKEVFDKEEAGLIVTFVETYAFYRGGDESEGSAVIDVRYIGSFSLEQKQAVTKQVAATMERAAACMPQKISVLFSEIASENWGRNAGEYR